MMGKLSTYWYLMLAEMSSRASVIKIKINGLCVNKCSFCMFHSDPRRLEVADLERFFDMLDQPGYRRIDINGGEPSMHPGFAEVCAFLRTRRTGGVRLYLGTNLIPFARNSEKYRRRWQAALDTYDIVSVGCDDEHGNIEHLENLGPEIVQSGRLLFVNVMEDHCSPETRQRVVALKERLGMRVTYSSVHHYPQAGRAQSNRQAPCRRRTKELLLNCDGNAYFCFHQEFARPLFNLHTVTRQDLNYYLNEYDPPPYEFCAQCPLYSPERQIPLLSRR